MECQKHLFSLDPAVHYLNCAYKAPLLKSGEQAAIQALIRDRNPFQLEVDDYFNLVDKVRQDFSKIINCQPSSVAIIPSSSYGFGSVLKNTPAKPNGKAVTIKNEFPSGYFSIERWCKTNDNRLEIIAPDPNSVSKGENWNEAIIKAIDNSTSLVLLSSIHWMSGLKFDLKRIGQKCVDVGATFIVDGTQSVGALPMDVNEFNIDALICAGYKWLFGPYSLGLAFMGEKFNDGIPLEESWMNRSNAREFSSLTNYEPSYTQNAGRFNAGETSNFILMPVLHEGLKQLNTWGIDQIQSYCQSLVTPLKTFIGEIGGRFENERYFSNHLFALSLPSNVNQDQLRKNLADEKVFVSVRGENLRVSVNVFNDAANIDKLIEVIKTTAE